MQLVAGVEVWLVDLRRDGTRLATMADARRLLDEADQARFDAYRSAADAMAFAASRAALDIVLSRHSPEPLTKIRHARSGKPFAPGLPMFSLSHTRGYAAVAVAAEGPVGVDIEQIGHRLPEHRLIERIVQLLATDAPAEQRPLLAWTVAESWAKLHGMRLADLLDSVGQGRSLEEAISTGGPPVMSLLELPDGITGCCWHMMQGTIAAVRMLHDMARSEAISLPD